jgi:hypothetical protein
LPAVFAGDFLPAGKPARYTVLRILTARDYCALWSSIRMKTYPSH